MDECETDTAAIKALSLGLLGAGRLDADRLADSLTWQKGSDVLVGRDAVMAAIKQMPAEAVKIEDIAKKGRAAAVSGRLVTQQGARLFCQMIKFTNTQAHQVASIVSYEHELAPHER